MLFKCFSHLWQQIGETSLKHFIRMHGAASSTLFNGFMINWKLRLARSFVEDAKQNSWFN